MGSQSEPGDRFVRCRFPSLVDCSHQAQSSRPTPGTTSFRNQPVELPDIQLLRDFVITHKLSLEGFFSTVWALVLGCYIGEDAVSFGQASAQEFLIYHIDLAGASSFLDLGRRCTTAAMPADRLEDLAKFDTLLSIGKSAPSSTVENDQVFLSHRSIGFAGRLTPCHIFS